MFDNVVKLIVILHRFSDVWSRIVVIKWCICDGWFQMIVIGVIWMLSVEDVASCDVF